MPRRYVHLLSVSLSLLLSFSAGAAEPARGKTFRAGAFAIDISPLKLPVIVNGNMAEGKADKITDRLHARCLVLDDGTTQVALVVVDSCMVPRHLLDEAKEQIDQAKALDPSFYIVHLAEGRWLIQRGDLDGAKVEFEKSVAANPQVSNSSLALAITYYQNREIEQALQALDDAERLDPDDPIVSLVRTVIALNESNAGEAIRAAKATSGHPSTFGLASCASRRRRFRAL